MVGKGVAQAVLTKDIDRILRHTPPEHLEDSRMQLKDRTSPLYCKLFDTSCITWGGRSVYNILREARQLAVTIHDLGKGPDGLRYGIIFFYDGSNIPKERLSSPDFLCEKASKEIVSWTFKHVKGRWQGANAPFDAETDTLCSPD
jgi:hypothetical protein